MRRVFHPGEEWLYFRLYAGPETAETWLVDTLPVLLKELEDSGLIKKYFFLRYLDPLFHLRIRFHLSNTDHFGHIGKRFRELSANLIDQELVWKTEIGSYERELERYGEDWIETAEEIFNIDSRFWLSTLPVLRIDEDGENKRWQAALLSADGIFKEFRYPVAERILLLDKMIHTLATEIGGGKKLRLQIDEKFRQKRRHLERILTDPATIEIPGFPETLANRSGSMGILLTAITDLPDWDEKIKKGRISDIIHMSLNRGLRSKQRMHELVIYSFLRQLYVSEEARQ